MVILRELVASEIKHKTIDIRVSLFKYFKFNVIGGFEGVGRVNAGLRVKDAGGKINFPNNRILVLKIFDAVLNI